MAHKQNYIESIELNKQRRLASALISELFPDVTDIVIHMTYYHKGVNPILMIRTVNFWPSQHAYFNMDCMVKGCINGGFDLTPIITKMIKGHEKYSKGKLICNGKSSTLASGHASITYGITIKYKKTA